jgi:hypothetical protein
MPRDRDSSSGTDIRPVTQAILLRRRLRLNDLWEEAMEKPWLWLGLFLLLGTWALTPGAFLFSSRAVAGAIADRDYVASRDLLLNDDEATQAKRLEARNGVLPVYDFDPGVAGDRDEALAHFFAAGRQLLAQGKEAEARAEAVRELTAKPAGPADVKVSPEQARLLVARGFSSDLEDRVRGALAQTLRRGVVANKDQLLHGRRERPPRPVRQPRLPGRGAERLRVRGPGLERLQE